MSKVIIFSIIETVVYYFLIKEKDDCQLFLGLILTKK